MEQFKLTEDHVGRMVVDEAPAALLLIWEAMTSDQRAEFIEYVERDVED